MIDSSRPGPRANPTLEFGAERSELQAMFSLRPGKAEQNTGRKGYDLGHLK